MVHWSLMPNAKEIRKRISESRKGKCIGNQNGFRKGIPSWNKDLSKELQPRYGKPISEKQREAIVQNFSIKGEKPWNYGHNEGYKICSKILRQRIYDKYMGKCFHCGRQLPLNGIKTQIHHIIPWSESKSSIEENLMLLCYKCHGRIHMPSDIARNRKMKKAKQSAKY